MPKPSAQVTAAEISRLAGVTRATVSNWRRRHAEFPAPTGGTESSPLYDLASVQSWLAARGQTSAASAPEELRAALRLRGTGAAARVMPLVLTAAERNAPELAELAKLPDTGLVDWARAASAELAAALPRTDKVDYDEHDAGILRALLQCVHDEGGLAALDVLAERELEDSAASGAYATPAPLADLMARLLTHAEGQGRYPVSVFDPACGGGSLLAAAADQGAAELFAQDSLPVQAQRTLVRLRLAAPNAHVTARVGDSLRDDRFPALEADAVLSNPPYGDRDWGHDELAYDPRWAYGVPPSAESELAWVQHVLAHLAPGALAVLLLAPATASRATGRRVRTELLRAGALRAVIGLPPGAATPFHIGLHLWILQRPETTGAEQQKTAVLFTELSNMTASTTPDEAGTSTTTTTTSTRISAGRAKLNQGSIDWPALTAKTLATWNRFRADPSSFPNDPGIARAVPVIELLDDLVDVAPARHVRTAPTAADPHHVAREASHDSNLLRKSLATLADAAHLGTWPPTGDVPRIWRTATIADLTRGGALTVLRANLTQTRESAADATTIEDGDVLLHRVLGADGSAAGAARVADQHDAGTSPDAGLIVFRPDQRRLDPWFLAGFLAAQDNISSASTGTVRSSIQIDPRRLRVPLLPLDEQRSYGDAFRRVHELRTVSREAAGLVARTTDLLALGLTSGTLLPPPDTGNGISATT
jgi:hypothetical protein